jgi:hypothetical protein
MKSGITAVMALQLEPPIVLAIAHSTRTIEEFTRLPKAYAVTRGVNLRPRITFAKAVDFGFRILSNTTSTFSVDGMTCLASIMAEVNAAKFNFTALFIYDNRMLSLATIYRDDKKLKMKDAAL